MLTFSMFPSVQTLTLSPTKGREAPDCRMTDRTILQMLMNAVSLTPAPVQDVLTHQAPTPAWPVSRASRASVAVA